jgi:hypothetical protein
VVRKDRPCFELPAKFCGEGKEGFLKPVLHGIVRE